MKAVRRTPETEENTFASAVLDLPAGAHLRIKSVRIWTPKFHDESVALMPAAIGARMVVVDDFGDGTYDGLEFDDWFDLKPHPSLGFDPKRLKGATIRDFSQEEQAQLLEEDNWAVGRMTKADKLNRCLFSPDWEEAITLHPEKHWVGKERSKNKKGGSKSKIQEAQEVAEQLVLPFEDERLMVQALPS